MTTYDIEREMMYGRKLERIALEIIRNMFARIEGVTSRRQGGRVKRWAVSWSLHRLGPRLYRYISSIPELMRDIVGIS